MTLTAHWPATMVPIVQGVVDAAPDHEQETAL